MVQPRHIHIVHLNHTLEIGYFLRPGTKGALVCLHGLGADKSDFIGFLDDQRFEDYTLFAFDFPGHGESEYTKGLSLSDLADITQLCIKAAKIEHFILIGHSMGGAVGLLLSQKDPKTIHKFINIEGNLSADDCGFSRYICGMNSEKIAKDFSESPGIYDCARSLIDYSENHNLLETYLNLRIPTHYIYGSQSHISSLPILTQNQKSTISISNSGHHPFRENPEEFFSKISTFIN